MYMCLREKKVGKQMNTEKINCGSMVNLLVPVELISVVGAVIIQHNQQLLASMIDGQQFVEE